jgi:hypothetical protein
MAVSQRAQPPEQPRRLPANARANPERRRSKVFKRLTLAAASALVLTAALLVAQGASSNSAFNGTRPSEQQVSAPPALSIDWGGAMAMVPR